MNHYVHNISSIAFSIFGISFPWYWLIYFVGYFWVLYSLNFLPTKLIKISKADFHRYVFGGFFAMLFFAKFFYVIFYNPSLYLQEPFRIFKVWEGGMSFHGAILGIVFWSYYFSRRINKSFLHLTDIVATSAPLVLFFGRLANFANGELAGRYSDVSWAVVFPRYLDGIARHPSQLYEAVGEGLILFYLMWSKRCYLVDYGRQSIRFLFLYGLIRFICEFFRAPDIQLGLFLSLTIGQIYCLIMIAASYLMFIKNKS